MYSWILGLLLASPAFATIPTLEGDFSFTGETTPAVKIEYVNVNVTNDDQRHYLNSMIEAGYTCWPLKTALYQCRLTEHITAFPPEVLLRIKNMFQEFNVNFAPGSYPQKMIYSGDVFEEWQVDQPVYVNGKQYNYYRIMVLPDLFKLEIGQAGDSDYWSFVIVDPKHIEYMIEMGQTHNKGWTNYVGFLSLTN